MADYREISQGYARGAISAAILVNGGAAVAVLSQLSELTNLGLKTAAAFAMMLWVIGIGSGAVIWVLAFASTRYVDRFERANEPPSGDSELVISDKYQNYALCLFFFSIFCFIGGAAFLLSVHAFDIVYFLKNPPPRCCAH